VRRPLTTSLDPEGSKSVHDTPHLALRQLAGYYPRDMGDEPSAGRLPQFEPDRLLEQYRRLSAAPRAAAETDPWSAFLCLFELMTLEQFGTVTLVTGTLDTPEGFDPVWSIVSSAEASERGLREAIDRIVNLQIPADELEDYPAEEADDYGAEMAAFAGKLGAALSNQRAALSQLEDLEAGLRQRAADSVRKAEGEAYAYLGFMAAAFLLWVVGTFVALFFPGRPISLGSVEGAMGYGLLAPLAGYAAFGLGVVLWSIGRRLAHKS
jgi:hypothetical protein